MYFFRTLLSFSWFTLIIKTFLIIDLFSLLIILINALRANNLTEHCYIQILIIEHIETRSNDLRFYYDYIRYEISGVAAT